MMRLKKLHSRYLPNLCRNMKTLLWNLSKRKMFWEKDFLLYFIFPHWNSGLESQFRHLPKGLGHFLFPKVMLLKKQKLHFIRDVITLSARQEDWELNLSNLEPLT